MRSVPVTIARSILIHALTARLGDSHFALRAYIESVLSGDYWRNPPLLEDHHRQQIEQSGDLPTIALLSLIDTLNDAKQAKLGSGSDKHLVDCITAYQTALFDAYYTQPRGSNAR